MSDPKGDQESNHSFKPNNLEKNVNHIVHSRGLGSFVTQLSGRETCHEVASS